MTLEKEITARPVKDREGFFKELYEEAFPKVAAFVRKMDGTLPDARDIFHDALIIFYEKVVDNKVFLHVSAEAYLLGIAKHLWLRKFREDRSRVTLDDLESEISIPGDYFIESEKPGILKLIEFTGQKCLELLRSFYYDKLSMYNIAMRFGYSSERSATVQKYKCMEKIRNKIKENTLTYEDFIA